MKILVVEDDPQLQLGLGELLSDREYEVEIAEDSRSAKRTRKNCLESGERFDLYLLDIMLGDCSGFELCRAIREEEETPVIFLTALADEEYVIKGLDIGGDDYITKPFRGGELLARIAAHLRRHVREKGKDEEQFLVSGDLLYQMEEERVYLKGQEIVLRKVEQELLKLFLESDGRLLRREQILEYIWDQKGEFVEDNTLSVQISRLRKHLGKYEQQDYIVTLRGIGYRWNHKIEKKNIDEIRGITL